MPGYVGFVSELAGACGEAGIAVVGEDTDWSRRGEFLGGGVGITKDAVCGR